MNESTRFNLDILLNVDSSPASTSLSTADLWSIGISFTALLISLFIGGWTIYRDCIDKGRFKIRMGLYEIINTNGTISPSFLEIKITNYGTKPLGLGNSGFLRKDNTQVSFNELLATPHENLIDIGRSKTLSIPNEKLRTLIAEVDNIKAFYVYDALDKIHQPSKKELKKLLHDLRKLKI